MVSNSLGPFLALASAARAASAGAGTAAETAPAAGKTASGTTGTPGISSASLTAGHQHLINVVLPAAFQKG